MQVNRRIYLYKMICDNGGAPCIQNKLLSLAICKPQIRKQAEVGSLILGFVGKTMIRHASSPPDCALIYAARVTKVIPGKEYYDDRGSYSRRADSIYRWNENEHRFHWIKNDFHDNPDSIDHDLGKNRDHCQVLLSNNYRYFGRVAKRWEEFKLVTQCVEHMTQGHRVNHSDELFKELERLETKLWGEPALSGTKPIQNPDGLCIRDDEEASCEVKCSH